MPLTPGAKPAAGFGRPLFRFLGSIKLAMLLLAVIIVACIVGTIAESRFDTAVAQAYFYDAPWFFAWLILLCVNLVAAVLVRYPWKPHQIGFIITHAGIVILLVGGMVGRIWGVEGFVTLHKGKEPLAYLQLNRTSLQARSSQDPEGQSKDLSLRIRPPTPERPLRLQLKDVSVVALDTAPALGSRTIVENGVVGPAAVRLVLRGGMVAQPIDTWLVLNDRQRDAFAFGPARIRFLPETAEQAGAQATDVKDGQPVALVEPSGEADSIAEVKQASRERHFAFAKMPEMSMARPVEGPPSGAKISYQFSSDDANAREEKGVLHIQIEGEHFHFPIAQLLNGRTTLGDTSWSVQEVKYLPDFRIEGKEAVSISDQPNNPAVLFELSGEVASGSGAQPADTAAKQCNHAPGECDHAGHVGENGDHSCCDKSKGHGDQHGHVASDLTIYYASDRTLRYATSLQNKAGAKGHVELGRPFATGLADWTLEASELIHHATVREELAPLSAQAPTQAAGEGVKVRVTKGGDEKERWIAAGLPAHLKFGDETVHVSFGYLTHPLDFGVALDHFEVDRDEGTQNPAGFKSRVRFIDPKRRAVPLERDVWMNNPANYPDFPGVGLLGTAYKFSQASWNPNDLNQTTLQVLRDPGWSLKWIGSLMLCAGLFTMFYLKPYPRFAQPKRP